ncbi:hypothetical protein [uncultured Phascolarctobacterium sp.]|uniref:hypothetical protein n=1 Tax=uncultured Phascolarctobacterium sp. TaxID=512296 RepID=UPI0025F08A28|nr:hypothetical protein [uncultured Phascolarctobacterium sp.]
MSYIFDFSLILSTSLITYYSYRSIIYKQNTSSANYLIILLYIFCVVPIILNFIVGIPEYKTIYWYKPFIGPMRDENITVIYDLYIFASILSLKILAIKNSNLTPLLEYNTFTYLVNKSFLLKWSMICLPLIYIILTGSWEYYTVYAVSSMRGMSETQGLNLLTPCMLVSMVIFFSCILKKNITFKEILLVLFYSIAIIWLSGKRFMMANIIFVFTFYLVNLNLSLEKRKKIYKVIPVLSIVLLIFSMFYLVAVRPMTETTWISLYDMLRVDFGRDDVIKFVINKEIIEDERMLDYYGQSFIGLIGSFIPRAIWESKPYPHYMYLTSAILNLDIHSLPAGTTPSLLEMVICNFNFYGFIVGIFTLVWLCNFIDKLKDIDSKAIGLILALAIVTQSMDVYLILVAMFIAIMIVMLIVKYKKIYIKFKI